MLGNDQGNIIGVTGNLSIPNLSEGGRERKGRVPKFLVMKGGCKDQKRGSP